MRLRQLWDELKWEIGLLYDSLDCRLQRWSAGHMGLRYS